jgi:hypothetical protein
MVSLTLPPTRCCGLGKLATPFVRMHCEKASSEPCDGDVVAAVVVDEATLATPADVRPPPQPAAISARGTTATSVSRRRCMSCVPFVGDIHHSKVETLSLDVVARERGLWSHSPG